MSLLVLDTLTKSFGGLSAVDDLSLEVRVGEIFALIGPNGAGKSTTFNLIDRKSTRLNSSHSRASRMPSSA